MSPPKTFMRLQGNTQVLNTWMQQDDFHDTIIWVEGKEINAHRIVLSAGSEYFHQILKHYQAPFKMPILILTDVKFRFMKEIISWMYKGHATVLNTELDAFFQTAKKLKVVGLSSGSDECIKQACVNEIDFADGINSSNRNIILLASNGQASASRQQNIEHVVESCESPKRVLTRNPTDSSPNVSSHSSIEKTSKRTRLNRAVKDKSGENEAQPSKNRGGSSISTAANANGNNNGSDSQTLNDSDGNTENQYKCNNEQCGKVCTSSQQLIRHKKYKCGKEKSFKCPTCSKGFHLRIRLNHHQIRNKKCQNEIDL